MLISLTIAIDTGILLGIFFQELNYRKKLELIEKIGSKDRVISVITIAEIISKIYKKDENDDIVVRITNLLGKMTDESNIMPVTKEIATLAGKLKSKYKFALGDSIITATAIISGCDAILTEDQEFEKIEEIKVIRV